MFGQGMTARGLVTGFLRSQCAFALWVSLIAGSAALLLTGQAQAGKVLRIGNGGEPESMDPALVSVIQGARIVSDMNLGLMTCPGGKAAPGAAESWTVSEDGLTYTFKIRDHNWSDGVPVTAQDFVAGWKRVLAPKTGAGYANILYIIEGAEGINKGEKGAELAAKALDDHSLEVRLTNPAPYFLTQLCHRSSYAIPRHIVEKYGKDWVKPENIVVNGPYKLVEWLPNVHVKLLKNEAFYDAANVAIDEVIYYSQSDAAALEKRFRAGELDVARSVPAGQISWLRDNLSESLRIAPYAAIYYYAVRTDKEKFKDQRVRKALSLAINREAITDQILKAGEIPAYSFVPPGTGDYKPATVSWKDMPYADRLKKARKLLADAGYGADNPLKFVLRYNTSEKHKRIAVAIQDMWKQIGVEAELFNTEINIHYADMRVGDFEVARGRWSADYSDAKNFLFFGEKRTGWLNFAAYDNPRFNKLMRAAEKENDAQKRNKLMHQAEAIMMEEQPYIPIYYPVSVQLVSPKVRGWVGNIMDTHPVRWLDIAE